ncbi:hypothetical protein ACQ4N7_28930 [Nodosilinea sp. AN01ver1]|uniref:hypothetical protein n=1 Tax=Nodosilinea sp. AN01ver1 TaxID=3423362 RepID=UPI003D31C797
MTISNGEPSRLERIEALLERSIIQHNQEMTEIRAGLRETRNIADSNARSVQAWETRIEDGITEAEEVSSSMAANTNRRMEDAITDTVQLVGTLANQFDQDRQRFDQLHQEHGQRFNNLLQESRADRQEWRQKFDEQMAESKAAREQAERERVLNENEHRAFRETFQTLLGQISRIWDRLAG